VLHFLEKLFGKASRPALADDGEGAGAIRYRPRLIPELMADHALLRKHMRAVLDACRLNDEDAQIIGLQHFAIEFRRVALSKSVLMYPYLRWATARSPIASGHLQSLHAEANAQMLGVDALLREYLQGPWLKAQRRRLYGDIAKIARLLGHMCRLEESALFPLYLTPGHYRHSHELAPH
jgi:Hemerythrin HHE cation binding domain